MRTNQLGILALLSLGLIGSVSAQTGGPNSVFTVPVPAADVAFDPVRPYAYVSGYDSKSLFVLNLSNGVVEAQFSFSYNPESIAIAPNGQKMYVALLRRPHSPYWFGGHTNYIAEFDLAQMTKTKEFMILADPGDLAVTDSGILVVPGGSDQWTDIRTYRTSDGGFVDSRSIRQSSRVSLHASQRAVYTADTDVSPSDIQRYDFDPVTGSFLSTWELPYWGGPSDERQRMVFPQWHQRGNSRGGPLQQLCCSSPGYALHDDADGRNH